MVDEVVAGVASTAAEVVAEAASRVAEGVAVVASTADEAVAEAASTADQGGFVPGGDRGVAAEGRDARPGPVSRALPCAKAEVIGRFHRAGRNRGTRVPKAKVLRYFCLARCDENP